MRIVHILKGKANPDTLNGINKVVHWLATTQVRQGHEVEVWGLAESMKLPPHVREYKLRLFPVTRLRLTLGREIKAALASLEPGTWVQCHCAFTYEHPAIGKFLKKRGLPYGITAHGLYAPDALRRNPWRKRLWIALYEARYLRNAAMVQAIGATEIQDVLRIAPGARVVLIPNGQLPLPSPVNAEPIGAARPLIGFCGRLAMMHKGLDYLIEGFAAYKAKGGAGELWLIGDSIGQTRKDRAVLEGLAAHRGVSAHVRFLGARHGDEKFSILGGFDAFIHSSRFEGLPGACLEAAALGRPLVVSRETNLGEYVERSGAGLVLDETSAAGVTRALDTVQRLYESRQLQLMGENARRMIENEFSWEKIAKSFDAAIVAASSCAEKGAEVR